MMTKKPTILVVDDEPVALATIENFLVSENYTVVTAASGEKAWELLNTGDYNFSAIITDRMMPGMDGIELTKKIYTHAVFRKIPVLMINSASERSDFVNAIQGGVFDFLMKPIEKELLLLVLKRALTLNL
jgi:CheY-like chemotaxis protein